MIFAQISSGVVQNTIVLEDESLSPTFAAGFEHFIRIDQILPMPGIGWSFDGENFIAPPSPPVEDEEPEEGEE